MGILEKIKELEHEYARTQKNKATGVNLDLFSFSVILYCIIISLPPLISPYFYGIGPSYIYKYVYLYGYICIYINAYMYMLLHYIYCTMFIITLY
jgi:hypothetical protein